MTGAVKDVSISIIKGEAWEMEMPVRLKARLLKTGDYVFEVSTSEEPEREISFNIEIKEKFNKQNSSRKKN